MHFTLEETATILAALRMWQAMPDGWKAARFDDIATDGGTLVPLNADQIDTLCERINTSDEPATAGADTYRYECDNGHFATIWYRAHAEDHCAACGAHLEGERA